MKSNDKMYAGLALIVSVILFGSIMLAGTKSVLNGKVIEKETSENIFGATIKVLQNGKTINTSVTDIDGAFEIKGLEAGTYNLEISALSYKKKTIKGIKLEADKTKTLKIELENNVVELQSLEIKSDSDKTKNEQQSLMDETVFESYNLSPTSYGVVSDFSAGSFAWSADASVEEYDYQAENEFHDAKRNPLSTFSIDVDGASYSNIRRIINEGHLPPPDAVRVEEMINYFKYEYPQPTGEDPFSITSEVGVCPWNHDHKIISIGLQGKKSEVKSLPPSNLVFLVDVSGSMESADKLPLLKKALALLTDQLRDQDRIALVVYAGNAGLVLESTPGSEKGKIRQALELLEAGGSTAGGEGIELAYRVAKKNFIPNGNNRVILATDGDFNVGISSEGDLVRMIEEKRSLGIFLTVLGFGTGNLKDSKMEKLADKGNGNYSYIDNILEAKKVLVNEIGGTLFTIAKDVKLQLEFNPAVVKSYKLIGYENRMLEDKDFNDDTKDAGELGSGHTVTALYEIALTNSPDAMVSIDPLKYQDEMPVKNSTDEILTVKFRYKDPQGETSKLITRVVKNQVSDFSQTSTNFRFSSAVAAFGMILRKSKFKGDADYNMVLKLAKDSKGSDDEGYRSEFIRLVEMAQLVK